MKSGQFKKGVNISYPISLEVNENSSSDLGNQDEQEAGEVLGTKKNVL